SVLPIVTVVPVPMIMMMVVMVVVMIVIIVMMAVVMIVIVVMMAVLAIMSMIMMIVFAGKRRHWKQSGSNYRANQSKLAKHLGFSLLPTDSRNGTISQDQC